jgi:hypothetical protein
VSWRDHIQPDTGSPTTPGGGWRSHIVDEVPERVFDGKAERAAEDKKLVDSMPWYEQAAVGAGNGLINTGRNVADIVGHVPGLGGLRPDRQEWADSDALVKPVTDTTAGAVGEVIGETLPTLPIGGLAGAGGKALLARALPMALRAAPALAQAPKVLKALRWAAPLVAEGGAQGFVLGGPDNRLAGAGAGAGLNVGFGALGEGFGAARRAFGKGAQSAEVAAAELGAQKAAKATRTARAEAGNDAQALYRTLEHLRELKARATPAAIAELERLGAQGIRAADIEAELFRKSAQKLGGDVSAANASGAAFKEALQSEGARAGELAEEASKSSLGADAWSLFKMYGEPIVGAAAGTAIGNQLGSPMLGGAAGTLGGLIFGRTRAGKALRTRLAKPGNQIALNRAGEGVAAFGQGLFGTGAPTSLSTQALLPDAPQYLSPLLAQGENQDPQMLAQLARAEALRRRQEAAQ